MTRNPLALRRSSRSFSVAALALAAGAALTLTSCSSTPASSSADGKLQVVATTTQLTDFVSEVGGDNVELTGLLAPGASAHHFDPTPADLLALGKADVLVVNGAGLETFIDGAVKASGFKGKIVTASDGIDQNEAKKITAEGEEVGHADHDHADEAHADEAHADETHADETHADEAHADEHAAESHDEHDHDHGDINPHIWTSPRLAQGMTQEIAAGLAKADPDHKADYQKNADAYIDQLQDLDTWIAAEFKRVPEADRVIVSGHDSLRYYLHDYDIEFAGAILPSFEDNAEPSAADVDALVQSIKERGVKAVFVESSMSPKLAQTIAQEAGVKVVDAESLYADSLGAKGSGADTYIDATIHNTQLILDSWGVTPEKLPATLQK